MAEATISLTLRGGERDASGFLRYEPGDELAGTVELVPRGNLDWRRVAVRVQWHTEGRGDRDECVVAEQELFQGPLADGSPRVAEFRLTLPREPWSYAGRYISIVWEVVLVVDLPLRRDIRHSQPFILAPGPGPRALPSSGAERR